MTDSGDTKDDVKVPDGEIGDKINKLFKEDEKDTSKRQLLSFCDCSRTLTDCSFQTSSSLLPWVRSPALTPRRLQRVLERTVICLQREHLCCRAGDITYGYTSTKCGMSGVLERKILAIRVVVCCCLPIASAPSSVAMSRLM